MITYLLFLYQPLPQEPISYGGITIASTTAMYLENQIQTTNLISLVAGT